MKTLLKCGIIFSTLLAFELFGGAGRSVAADIYLAQTVQGADTGADCSNAHSASWFNTAGNWANPKQSGKIGPGDIAHLCGTFTGSANATILTAQNSGSSGNPITIKWEAGAVVTSPACSSSTGCVSTGGRTYLVLDGNGTNPSITSTNNGSAAGGFANHISARGILASGCTGCELKNLAVTNMYRFTDVNDSAADSTAIFIQGYKNLSIHDNTLDQTSGGIAGPFNSGDANVSIYNNTFDHFNHGVEIGNNNSNTISNVYIYNNHLKNMSTWDSTGNWYHHDGIFFYQSSAGSMTNVQVYNNIFDGDLGANSTGWIYFNSGLDGIYVYNNVLLNPAGRGVWLMRPGAAGQGDHNFYILNNYIDCNGASAGASGVIFGQVANLTFENNSLNNCYSYLYAASGNVVVGTGTIDYNVYANGAGGGNAFIWNATRGSYSTYRSAYPSQDVHSTTPASVGADSAGHPSAGSALIDAGANLTTFGITALTSDRSGSARPGTGAWTIGAYQFTGSTPKPSPPGSLRVN